MKIRDIIGQEKATLSFEVFPPKKDTDLQVWKLRHLELRHYGRVI